MVVGQINQVSALRECGNLSQTWWNVQKMNDGVGISPNSHVKLMATNMTKWISPKSKISHKWGMQRLLPSWHIITQLMTGFLILGGAVPVISGYITIIIGRVISCHFPICGGYHFFLLSIPKVFNGTLTKPWSIQPIEIPSVCWDAPHPFRCNSAPCRKDKRWICEGRSKTWRHQGLLYNVPSGNDIHSLRHWKILKPWPSRNSGFSHWTWWFSIVTVCKRLPEGHTYINGIST